jgi:hypothetical protein
MIPWWESGSKDFSPTGVVDLIAVVKELESWIISMIPWWESGSKDFSPTGVVD